MIKQKVLIKISAKTNGRCFYCNEWGEEVEHFVSRKKHEEWELSGEDKIENLFLSCQSCNAKKGSKCPEDFIGNSWKAWSRYFRANHRVGVGLNYSVKNIF